MYIPTTLSELIEYGYDLEVSNRVLNNKVIIHNSTNQESIQIPFDSMVNKYREYFDDYSRTVTLDSDEEREYKYNPRKLSNDLYKSPEFWYLLLYLNDCKSVVEFKPEKKIKTITPDNLREIINEIIIIERG